MSKKQDQDRYQERYRNEDQEETTIIFDDVDIDIGAENQPEFVCEICGKRFDNERSLRGHMLRAHRVAKGKSPSPRRSAGEGRGVDSEEEREVPDVWKRLEDLLQLFGLKRKSIDKIITHMRQGDYSPDDFEILNEDLRIEGVNTEDRRRIIELWCKTRGLDDFEIENVLRRLKLGHNYHKRHIVYEDYYEPTNSRNLARGGRSEIAEMLLGIAQILRELRPEYNYYQSRNGGDDSYVQALIEQNRQLQQQIQQLQQQLQQKEIEFLRSEIKRLEEQLQESRGNKSEIDITLKKLDILDKRLGEIVEFVKDLAKPPKRPAREEAPEASQIEEDLVPSEIVYEEEGEEEEVEEYEREEI